MSASTSNRRALFALALALATAPLGGCGLGDSGSVRLTTFGEAFIEQGIPAAEPGAAEGVVDGYAITYDKFLLVLSGVRVADASGAVAAREDRQRVFDLTRPGPHEVARFDDIDPRRWDDVGVDNLVAKGAIAANADRADVAMMNDRGYSIYVAGRATRGGETFTFRWGFTVQTRYGGCVDADGRPGVSVPAGGVRTAQLTIHGDHLFFDDLASGEAKLRFAPMAAADADGDKEITLAELARVDLTTLPLDQYGTGSDGTVRDLAQFVTAQTRSLVHFEGEGHCLAR